jgi:hypothetical protein
VKFTLIHWRNCLEELVPEVKESTRLRDQPDPAVGEVPASRGGPGGGGGERGGRGWKNWLREQFTPTPPFYMD